MKSPIRWAGSKRALLPVLREEWDIEPGARYIEPFCGSACLFFEIEPKEAILGDINAELVITYRTLQKSASKVIECLRRYPRTEANYYRLRKLDPTDLSGVEQAARFIFLNRLCFNGIYRTNLSGNFNVPYGKPKSPGSSHFDFEAILRASSLLKHTTFINADFEAVLDHASHGDFVYLDPPYAVAKRRVFSEYHPDTFTERDVDRLRGCLTDLDKRGVRFVVSYADSTEGRKLASGWKFRRLRARRNVAGFANHRRHAYEVLFSNRELTNGHQRS